MTTHIHAKDDMVSNEIDKWKWVTSRNKTHRSKKVETVSEAKSLPASYTSDPIITSRVSAQGNVFGLSICL